MKLAASGFAALVRSPTTAAGASLLALLVVAGLAFYGGLRAGRGPEPDGGALLAIRHAREKADALRASRIAQDAPGQLAATVPAMRRERRSPQMPPFLASPVLKQYIPSDLLAPPISQNTPTVPEADAFWAGRGYAPVRVPDTLAIQFDLGDEAILIGELRHLDRLMVQYDLAVAETDALREELAIREASSPSPPKPRRYGCTLGPALIVGPSGPSYGAGIACGWRVW